MVFELCEEGTLGSSLGRSAGQLLYVSYPKPRVSFQIAKTNYFILFSKNELVFKF
jgi:hypothetical protein